MKIQKWERIKMPENKDSVTTYPPKSKVESFEEQRKITLDHMVDEKFGEIFFIAKDEYDIKANTTEEQKLWDLLQKFKDKLKKKCRHHFSADEDD